MSVYIYRNRNTPLEETEPSIHATLREPTHSQFCRPKITLYDEESGRILFPLTLGLLGPPSSDEPPHLLGGSSG